MKHINEFVETYEINESKSFTLTSFERDSICELLGYLTGNLGEERDIKKFEKYWNSLSEDEQNDIQDLYDVFEDDVTWPKVTRRLIVDDIDMLRNFLNWVDENDVWGDCEYEGVAVLEKL